MMEMAVFAVVDRVCATKDWTHDMLTGIRILPSGEVPAPELAWSCKSLPEGSIPEYKRFIPLSVPDAKKPFYVIAVDGTHDGDSYTFDLLDAEIRVLQIDEKETLSTALDDFVHQHLKEIWCRNLANVGKRLPKEKDSHVVKLSREHLNFKIYSEYDVYVYLAQPDGSCRKVGHACWKGASGCNALLSEVDSRSHIDAGGVLSLLDEVKAVAFTDDQLKAKRSQWEAEYVEIMRQYTLAPKLTQPEAEHAEIMRQHQIRVKTISDVEVMLKKILGKEDLERVMGILTFYT